MFHPCPGVFLTFPSIPGCWPESAPISQHPGAPFPIAQHHSPSVTAVPTEQGVQRALQEIEVPFGNQRPQRKHVTLMDTLWAHVPTLHVWTYVYGPYQIDALWIPLPLLYVQPQVPRSLGRYTAGSSAPSGISSVPSVVVQSEYSRGTERLEECVCVCMGLPCTCTGYLTEGRGWGARETRLQGSRLKKDYLILTCQKHFVD